MAETESDLLARIRVHGAVPRHIAIIMDGNGRWARERHMPRPFGHRSGMKAVRAVVEGCLESGVEWLSLFISYGGRAELVRAARILAEEVQAGRLAPEAITEDEFRARLFTAACPDPDLLIRTSGEQRLSNFLLWQVAYAELFISSVLWPDFGRAALYDAINDFQHRDRRFGRVRT